MGESNRNTCILPKILGSIPWYHPGLLIPAVQINYPDGHSLSWYNVTLHGICYLMLSTIWKGHDRQFLAITPFSSYCKPLLLSALVHPSPGVDPALRLAELHHTTWLCSPTIDKCGNGCGTGCQFYCCLLIPRKSGYYQTNHYFSPKQFSINSLSTFCTRN